MPGFVVTAASLRSGGVTLSVVGIPRIKAVFGRIQARFESDATAAITTGAECLERKFAEVAAEEAAVFRKSVYSRCAPVA